MTNTLAFSSKLSMGDLIRSAVWFNCSVGSLDPEYLSQESSEVCSEAEKSFVERMRSVSES